MDEIHPGMTVMDRDDFVGVITEVTGPPSQQTLTMVHQDGTTHLLEPDSYRVENGTLRLAGQLSRATGSEQELTIPVIREEATIRRREVERGGVRVHKTVREHDETVEQPVYREHVDVERVPIGRVVEIAPETREEGDTLIIPVMEEMLIVEKRLVLKEELRITRRRMQETEQAQVTLREEQVQIERIDDGPSGASRPIETDADRGMARDLPDNRSL